MPSIVLDKKLIMLNLIEDIYKYYNIQVLKVGYNDFHVIFHSGEVNKKGTKVLKTFKSHKEAMATAYSKFHEKKAEGFEEKEDMAGWLGQSEKRVKEKTGSKEKHVVKRRNLETQNAEDKNHQYVCDDCKKPIKKEVYEEINKWGRNGGGWDKDVNFVGYQKVLCISCQWKYDIFKKRL
jgi:predicted DNA-binding WGR domain protein